MAGLACAADAPGAPPYRVLGAAALQEGDTFSLTLSLAADAGASDLERPVLRVGTAPPLPGTLEKPVVSSVGGRPLNFTFGPFPVSNLPFEQCGEPLVLTLSPEVNGIALAPANVSLLPVPRMGITALPDAGGVVPWQPKPIRVLVTAEEGSWGNSTGVRVDVEAIVMDAPGFGIVPVVTAPGRSGAITCPADAAYAHVEVAPTILVSQALPAGAKVATTLLATPVDAPPGTEPVRVPGPVLDVEPVPDLTVSGLAPATEALHAGEATELVFTVMNVGTAAATRPTFARLWPIGTVIPIPSIAPGESHTGRVGWIPAAGKHEITVELEAETGLPDPNWANDAATLTLLVADRLQVLDDGPQPGYVMNATVRFRFPAGGATHVEVRTGTRVPCGLGFALPEGWCRFPARDDHVYTFTLKGAGAHTLEARAVADGVVSASRTAFLTVDTDAPVGTREQLPLLTWNNATGTFDALWRFSVQDASPGVRVIVSDRAPGACGPEALRQVSDVLYALHVPDPRPGAPVPCRVRLVDAAGRVGADPFEDAAFPAVFEVLPHVTSLATAYDLAGNAILVSWGVPENLGGHAIRGFMVTWRSAAGTGTWCLEERGGPDAPRSLRIPVPPDAGALIRRERHTVQVAALFDLVEVQQCESAMASQATRRASVVVRTDVLAYGAAALAAGLAWPLLAAALGLRDRRWQAALARRRHRREALARWRARREDALVLIHMLRRRERA